MKGLSVFAAVAMALTSTISGQPVRVGTLNSPVPVNEPVTHIVMFQFNNGTGDIAKDLASKFLALKDTCILPTTGRTYIKSLTGGKDNSPEGIQGGVGNPDRITDAFVSEFQSLAERDYYVNADPVHGVFKNFVKTLVDNGTLVGKKVQVVDYTPGIF